MASQTKQQLVNAVLRDMRVLPANQDASGSDFNYIAGVYARKLEEWKDMGLAYWTVDATPLVVFDTVVNLIVNATAPTFGRRLSAVEKAQSDEFLEKKLRKHIAKPASGNATMAEYY